MLTRQSPPTAQKVLMFHIFPTADHEEETEITLHPCMN